MHASPTPAALPAARLGLPESIVALLFDLGVLTRPAAVHAAAWKEVFDRFLRVRAQRTGEPLRPVGPVADYDACVVGRPRADGTRTFLAPRGITLPEGSPLGPPGARPVNGLGTRNNEIVLHRIRNNGVETYPGSVDYVRQARDAGLPRAVVSSSANTRGVLRAAGIDGLFDARVDGVVARRAAPTRQAGTGHAPGRSACPGRGAGRRGGFRGRLAGVEAGRAGGFGWVVGVDRVGQADGLRAHGANTVVDDHADLLGQSGGPAGGHRSRASRDYS